MSRWFTLVLTLILALGVSARAKAQSDCDLLEGIDQEIINKCRAEDNSEKITEWLRLNRSLWEGYHHSVGVPKPKGGRLLTRPADIPLWVPGWLEPWFRLDGKLVESNVPRLALYLQFPGITERSCSEALEGASVWSGWQPDAIDWPGLAIAAIDSVVDPSDPLVEMHGNVCVEFRGVSLLISYTGRSKGVFDPMRGQSVAAALGDATRNAAYPLKLGSMGGSLDWRDGYYKHAHSSCNADQDVGVCERTMERALGWGLNAEAQELARRACYGGGVAGCVTAGQLADGYIGKLPRDTAEARRSFDKACSLGSNAGCAGAAQLRAGGAPGAAGKAAADVATNATAVALAAAKAKGAADSAARADSARARGKVDAFRAAVEADLGPPLTPLPDSAAGAVIPRVLALWRRRAAAAGVTANPTAPLPPDQARSLIVDARQSLQHIDSALQTDAGGNGQSLSKLQPLLASDVCTSSRPSGCTDLWSWAYHAMVPPSLEPERKQAFSKLNVLICQNEPDLSACEFAFLDRRDGDGWWGKAGTPAVAAMALGYAAQACSIKLKSTSSQMVCAGLAACLTGNHDPSRPANPDPCGPPDLNMAAAVYRLACRDYSFVCGNGQRALAEARQWKRFFPAPPPGAP